MLENHSFCFLSSSSGSSGNNSLCRSVAFLRSAFKLFSCEGISVTFSFDFMCAFNCGMRSLILWTAVLRSCCSRSILFSKALAVSLISLFSRSMFKHSASSFIWLISIRLYFVWSNTITFHSRAHSNPSIDIAFNSLTEQIRSKHFNQQ